MPAVLNGLLSSKRFWLLVFGIVQVLVSRYLKVDTEVWQAVTALVFFLIAAYTVEDTAAALKSGDKS